MNRKLFVLVMAVMLMMVCGASAAMKVELEAGEGKVNYSFVGNNWARMICFPIEMGFMSNVQGEHLLSQPVYQQWLAEGMAQGVYEIALFRGLVEAE